MKKLYKTDILAILTILLLVLITVTGLFSFNTDQSYFFTNQYGDAVRLFGSGIYAHDSYFRAPIFIGSDFTMLFLVVPLMASALRNEIRNRNVKTKLKLTAMSAVVLYYAISIAFGVTYNSLHLLYIALFSCSFFLVTILMMNLDLKILQTSQNWKLTKGVRAFLIFSGLALFLAWLPDIIPTILSGKSLALIEVYTTEITYILDMGIISPLMFICLYLLQKRSGLGSAILSTMLTLCFIMGVMLPIQTIFQMLAGITIPFPVLIIKVGIFVLLALFAAYFNTKFYKGFHK
jgi:hypothetical protein